MVNRITDFAKGGEDGDGYSYQSVQARIAVAKGGLMGSGPGNSTQRNFLPHPYSDFIYAIVIEEYGLGGGAFIMLLYAVILFRVGVIGRKSMRKEVLNDRGMPDMPLVSMGGTSLLFTSAAFGVILSIAHTFSPEGEKEESERLKMKSEKQGRKNRREEYEPEEVLVDEVEDGELPEMQPRTVTPPTGRKPAEYDEDRDFDILGEEGIGEIRDELESEGREVLNELKRRGR